MLPDVVEQLRCPVCRAPLAEQVGSVRCPAGHTYDVARQGYLSFLVGRPSGRVGDDAEMVAARERFLSAGHFRPLTQAIVAAAEAPGSGLVVEVGAGTAHHLARVLDALPHHAGVAVDLSKYAARRAARAHPRAVAILADARAPLPLADGCAALVLDVFAPRHGPELRRIVRDDGALVVVTPRQDHLRELRATLGLVEVDPDKERRVVEALSPWFERGSSHPLTWSLSLTRADALALAAMGPSARVVEAAALAGRAAALEEPAFVTASCVVERWRPRSVGGASRG
jgi:23S rRNA (guanine745-N1)-methyltransferase